MDFARKLYLIENCIYGVDIQPIAAQIAKLRFFIALIVDQNVDPKALNLGVRPLPNLETKIVAADSLVGIERPGQLRLRSPDIDAKQVELGRVRQRHFSARTPTTKARHRQEDSRLRAEISDLLIDDGWDTEIASRLADWDPYDQNHAASFFDSEWMFGLTDDELEVDGRTKGGFDIVIGNPPYVRIQTLKKQNPELVEYYKENYGAAKGNYDLYVIFVEAGLNFLNPDGHLAYILPHKFFNAKYGESLRRILSNGKHLEHIVHFGDQQVFPGASNYVALLFLAKDGVDILRFVRADNLSNWLQNLEGTEGYFSATDVTDAEWYFTVGRDAVVFEHLRRCPQTLGQIAERISQGIRTSANGVFVLDVKDDDGRFIRAYSKQLGRGVTLESDAVSPFLLGREIKPFSIQYSDKAVIIPYQIVNGRMLVVPLHEIETKTPKLHDYLLENKKFLEEREDGRMEGNGWHGYIYPKNLEVMFEPKLLVPDIADHASFALDESGEFAFTSGYGITLRQGTKISIKYVLGLGNSHVLDFFWRKVSTPLRGGYYRYFTQFVSQLPIVDASPNQEAHVVRLVDYVLWLNKYPLALHGEARARDRLMLGYWEQALNGLVYELYFPEALHQRNLYIFDLVADADLPDLLNIPVADRLERLRKEFERLHDLDHPVRSALHDIQTVEEVRIIEGHA